MSRGRQLSDKNNGTFIQPQTAASGALLPQEKWLWHPYM
jgi:hypothetical protein